jgi:class 3 adenylate cyclase
VSRRELSREQLLQFLTPEAADAMLAAPGDPLAPRRLQASVLSCDVSGFRGLIAVDEGAAFEVLAGILEGAAAAIYAEQGTLMSFPGDGALAVFGAPIETGEHRRRAKRAAVAISGPVLEAATLELERRGLPAIGIDVAVESGELVAGVIGAEPRWEYAAIGAPTSRAIARTGG